MDFISGSSESGGHVCGYLAPVSSLTLDNLVFCVRMVIANGSNSPFAMTIIDFGKSIDGEAADHGSAAADICLLSERGGHRLKASLSSVRYQPSRRSFRAERTW